ncbi:thioredoxin family protein [uncultured Psychroserpens sp.]|uniref:DUF1223 domain-containing protein n=1 Tax=uncultured Psychroserpens sp. TaxID=255436 RepID=UPI00262D19DB|nr:DUF1223 domain-containing protein [uncultured Psychroserpens sp.]
MKHILLTLFMIPLLFSTEKVETYPPVTVLELFTSQGCSSCPPADKLLTAIQDRDDKNSVIALSYHVDYWNYIGWKDPFSKESFSDKQRSYSRKFNSSTIYTPQVVVNGKEHFVGSNEVVMKNKLKAYASIASKNKIDVTSIVNSQDNISFEYSIVGSIKNKVLRVALVIEERITKIARGENRNRTLKNSNIVVLEDKLNLKSATGTHQLTIPNLVNKTDKIKLVFIIQNTDLDILGASQVNL